jgi:hypothetical protein
MQTKVRGFFEGNPLLRKPRPPGRLPFTEGDRLEAVVEPPLEEPEVNQADRQSDEHTPWIRQRRLPLLAAVGALLLVCGAGQTLAGKGRQGDSASHEPSARKATALPGMSLHAESAKRRADARGRWRRGHEAKRARIRSRSAYANETRAEISHLLHDKFSSFLRSNDQVVEPEDVRRYTSDYTAILDPGADGEAGGPKRLAVSSVPLRTRTPADGKVPVDWSLEWQAGKLSPKAALVDFGLPAKLGEGIDLPHGVSLHVNAANPAATPSLTGEDTALYHDVADDTDLVVSSLPTGIELSGLLRSPQSPETYDLGFDLPEDASLEPTPDGGARVVRDGDGILGISPPSATDAQGAQVPARMEVEGDSARLVVPHRRGDWAYPILVDPLVWDDYRWNAGATRMDGWSGYNFIPGGAPANYSLSNTCMAGVACWGSGLFIYSWNGRHYPNGAQAGFQYTAPGAPGRTTYIYHVGMAPIHHFKGDYNLAPYFSTGLYDPAVGWPDWANLYDNFNVGIELWARNDSHPKYLNIGQYNSYDHTLAGHHYSYVGAVTVELWDQEDPVLDPLVASTGPPRWVNHESTTIPLHARDNGLGVQYFWTRMPDTGSAGGTRDANLQTTEAPGCTGATGSLCPVDGHALLAYDTASFPEGVNKIEVAATDAGGRREDASIRLMNVLVDRAGPQVDVSGGLVEPGAPNHQLRVDARDGDSSTFASARSGVRSIEVLWDGERADYEEQECDNQHNGVDLGSCDLYLAGSVDPDAYGPHDLKIVVKDRAENTTTRDWHLDLPDRTGPQLTLTGSLAERDGAWVAADEYQLSTKLEDTGTGAVRTQLMVDGESVDEIARSCPDGGCTLEHDFWLDLSRPGEHQVKLIGSDARGNETQKTLTVKVDAEEPTVTLSGELAAASETNLDDRSYGLTVSGADPAGGSGVRTVTVNVNDVQAQVFNNQCDPDCPQTTAKDYTFDPSRWSGTGFDLVEIVVTDAAGNAHEAIVYAGAPPDPNTGPSAPCPTDAQVTGGSIGAMTPPQAISTLLESTPTVAAPTEAVTEGGTSLDPSLSAAGASLTASGNIPGGEIDIDPAGGLVIGKSLCLKPATVSSAAEDAAIVNHDSAFYADVAKDTDVLLRPTAAGASALEQLRSPSAPQSYSWKVGLAEGQQLEQLDNRTIAVVDTGTVEPTELPDEPETLPDPTNANDAAVQLADATYQLVKAEEETHKPVVAVIRTPWIRDSSGTSVPAALTVDGNTVTLTIQHWEPPDIPEYEYDYPILAHTNIHSLGRSRGTRCTLLRVTLKRVRHWESYGADWVRGEVYIRNAAAVAGCVLRVCHARELDPGNWHPEWCKDNMITEGLHHYSSAGWMFDCSDGTGYFRTYARFTDGTIIVGGPLPPYNGGVSAMGVERRLCRR